MKTTQKLKDPSKPAPGFLGHLKSYWRGLGPGLTTGASDDDPSGIATYSQAGALFGFKFIWTAALTLPFMIMVQEMCARIGLVTGRGLAGSIARYYPKWVLYSCALLLFVANTFNIGANLGMMSQAVALLFPAVNVFLMVVVLTLFTLLLQIYASYKKYSSYLKWLSLILLVYVFSAFSANIDWGRVFSEGLVPGLGSSKGELLMLTAILGTTLSPYLFFWQTSQEVEEQILEGKTTIKQRQVLTRPEEISKMRIDITSGMFLSNMIMFFIIVVSGATIFGQADGIKTAADAALALRPFAGNAAYLLFTLGIIGTGMLSIPVLAGSSSYAVSESFGWKEGLYRKFNQAHAFYLVIIISMLLGLAMNFFYLDIIDMLIYSALLNGLVAPFILAVIVLLSSRKNVMGEWVNKPWMTVFGWIMTLLMAAAAASFLLWGL